MVDSAAVTSGGQTWLRYKSGPGRWVLLVTVLGSTIASIDATVVGIALPAIGRDFHAGLADLQWVVTAYTLTLAGLLLFAGALGGLLPPRRPGQGDRGLVRPRRGWHRRRAHRHRRGPRAVHPHRPYGELPHPGTPRRPGLRLRPGHQRRAADLDCARRRSRRARGDCLRGEQRRGPRRVADRR